MQVIPHPLVVAKEEHLVLDYRATNAATKLIPAIAGNTGCVLGKLVGRVETRGAIVLKKRSVKCVRARLRRDLPKSARYLAVFSVVIAGREFDFLHGVARSHDDGQPLDCLGVLDSIQ